MDAVSHETLLALANARSLTEMAAACPNGQLAEAVRSACCELTLRRGAPFEPDAGDGRKR